MLTPPPAMAAHLAQDARRLTICGIVQKANGQIIRCTQHDEDLTIDTGDFAGIYRSTAAITGSDMKFSSDMSVDNLEITSAVADGVQITGFDIADIAAGQFRSAPFQIFTCQWDNPDSWQWEINRGYLGQITRTAEGAFTAEWRGLLQVLQQNIGRVYGSDCDVVRFGDARCGLKLGSAVATVLSVTNRRTFVADFAIGSPPVALDALPAGIFVTGECKFVSGANAGYTKQIKRDSIGGTTGSIELWESFPADIESGDVVLLRPGCRRRFEDCQFWGNTVNFRGHGRWIPGMPKIIRAPGGEGTTLVAVPGVGGPPMINGKVVSQEVSNLFVNAVRTKVGLVPDDEGEGSP